ncbi:MAG: M48 family metallopeptidase [Rhodospirillales bacterium]|jgi:predicted metal-dependent hydrolase|nr:M48 family metallopeptidase [Rhodospirillales bacterium]
MDVPNAETVDLPNGPTQVAWRRSSRARRVSLRIDPRDGTVVVTLPNRAGRNAGVALLMTHADWVADRLAALPSAVRFADGATVPFLGRPHRIRHLPAARGVAWCDGDEICVTGRAEFLPRRLADFLRAEALRRLRAAALAKAALIGMIPKRITVKDTRSRWGSCAADGSIAFSWRLVMAPEFVQDYVAAHEVAHLRHMDHGPRFWALVERLTPHTGAAVPWLRGEGVRLLRVG